MTLGNHSMFVCITETIDVAIFGSCAPNPKCKTSKVLLCYAKMTLTLCIIIMNDKVDDDRLINAIRTTLPETQLQIVMWWEGAKTIIDKAKEADAIIISGSSHRIHKKGSACVPASLWSIGKPILGICYGFQLMAAHFGGKNTVVSHKDRKLHVYAKYLELRQPVFPFQVERSRYQFVHNDYIAHTPTGKGWVELLRSPDGVQVWAAFNPYLKMLGIQFHPEKAPKSAAAFFPAWLKFVI